MKRYRERMRPKKCPLGTEILFFAHRIDFKNFSSKIQEKKRSQQNYFHFLLIKLQFLLIHELRLPFASLIFIHFTTHFFLSSVSIFHFLHIIFYKAYMYPKSFEKQLTKYLFALAIYKI